MSTIIHSMRLYFWPILALNATAMTIAVRGDARHGALVSIVISLLASFGFLVNDLWDRNVDRINRPGRFENSDKTTIGLGVAAAIVCLILGIATAFWLGPRELDIAFILALGLAAYSIVLRRYLIVPTVLAGFLAASPIWAPLLLWPRNVRPMHWTFVAAMALLLAARETLMDLRDRDGDRIGARDTIATAFGARAAKSTASILLLSGAALLCSVLLVQTVHLTVPSALTAAVAVCLILALTLTPAYGAIRPDTEDRDQHGAIQSFLGWSRAAMLLLPLLNLFLWRG